MIPGQRLEAWLEATVTDTCPWRVARAERLRGRVVAKFDTLNRPLRRACGERESGRK